MPTVSELLNANFVHLHAASIQWAAFAKSLETAQQDAAAKVGSSLRDSQWIGLDADAAYRNLDRLANDLLHATAQARLVNTLLDEMHELFYSSQLRLKPLLDGAPGQYYVHEDGTVTYQTEPLGSDMYAAEYALAVNTKRKEAADAISAIMKAVNEGDARLADALRKLDVIVGTDTNLSTWQGQAQDAAAVAAVAPVDLAAIPRDNPAAAALWWGSLTEAQKNAYISLAPQLVGPTDGLPAVVRDQANRLLLNEERFRLEKEMESFREMEATPRSERPPEYRDPRNLDNAMDSMQQRLDGVLALQGKLDYQLGENENPYGQPVPPAFLLGYTTEGNGQAIVAIGNPDTADNVAINVPGTGAKLTGVGGLVDRAELVQAAAMQSDPSKTTSSIVWHGYDAPQNPLTESSRTVFADNAAPKLSQFTTALDLTHVGPEAHATVIAHSYGGLVAGRALEREGMTVDEAVFLGSVGTGPDHVSDLNMSGEHVWAGTAPNDAVPDWALSLNAGEWGRDHVRFGADPNSPGFGANTIPVAPGPTADWAPDFEAHSDYWDYRSSSLESVGKIVAGQSL